MASVLSCFFLSWIKLIQIGSLMNSLWNLSSPLLSSFPPACTSSHTCKPQRVKAFHRFFSCKPVFLHTVKVVISPFFFFPPLHLTVWRGKKVFWRHLWGEEWWEEWEKGDSDRFLDLYLNSVLHFPSCFLFFFWYPLKQPHRHSS